MTVANKTDVFSNMTQFTDTVKSQAAQAATSSPVSTQEFLPAVKVDAQTNSDTVEITSNKGEKKKRRGPIKTLKSAIANVKKFFASVGTYTKGVLKGIKNGIISGSVVYTGVTIYNKIKKKPANSKLGFILGGVTIAGSLIASIWNASLDLNEKKSDIDHRWTGHVK